MEAVRVKEGDGHTLYSIYMCEQDMIGQAAAPLLCSLTSTP
jgi:hypothetical protein